MFNFIAVHVCATGAPVYAPPMIREAGLTSAPESSCKRLLPPQHDSCLHAMARTSFQVALLIVPQEKIFLCDVHSVPPSWHDEYRCATTELVFVLQVSNCAVILGRICGLFCLLGMDVRPFTQARLLTRVCTISLGYGCGSKAPGDTKGQVCTTTSSGFGLKLPFSWPQGRQTEAPSNYTRRRVFVNGKKDILLDTISRIFPVLLIFAGKLAGSSYTSPQ
eukprot:scaffold4489_cov165-Amphora_coffeaeformis.AAC.2